MKGAPKYIGLFLVLSLAVAGVLLFVWSRRPPAGDDVAANAESGVASGAIRTTAVAAKAADGVAAKGAIAESDAAADAEKDDTAGDETPETEEARREAEAEKLVESFDELTDGWMEPSAKGVAMQDVDTFVARFSKLPAERKNECLHRALNLIPDENVMLLVGILMDRSQPKEYVEMVFNDILNRDEDVKKPILQQVFKDKTHPCWADTAWILDVTGETRD